MLPITGSKRDLSRAPLWLPSSTHYNSYIHFSKLLHCSLGPLFFMKLADINHSSFFLTLVLGPQRTRNFKKTFRKDTTCMWGWILSICLMTMRWKVIKEWRKYIRDKENIIKIKIGISDEAKHRNSSIYNSKNHSLWNKKYN